ncbi:ATP-binding protein [Hydrogenimonas sp.]
MRRTLEALQNPSRLKIVAILALLYFVSGKLSIEMQGNVNFSNIGLFAAEGFALAFALYFGRWVWPGIFVGQLLLALSNGFGLFPSLMVSTANSLEALLAIYIFSHLDFNTGFTRLKDLWIFLFVVAGILQPFSALAGNLSLWIYGMLPAESILQSTLAWWFGNSMGQFIVTPFLLIFLHRYKTINLLEFFIYGLLFACFIYIIEVVLELHNAFLLFGITLPPVIYVVANKGLAYGLALSTAASIVSAFTVSLGVGTFATGDIVDSTINFNLFIFALNMLVITMGILFEERMRQESLLKQRIEEALHENQEQQIMLMRQSRLAQMGEMIAMIAHQWRQPLNNLSLVNQLLIAKYKKGKLDDKTIEEFKVNTKKQITLMSTTIDDFRNFFKSEEKKTLFDVNEALETVLEMTQAIFTTHDIRIYYERAPGHIVLGTQNALAQAILNILNNARDALIEMSPKDARRSIRLALHKENGWVVITVEDNAGGIPEEIVAKIFDPYFSTKKEKNGTGLGLYMTRMIVEKQMEGHIEVCNGPEGATFKIYIREHARDTE